MALHTTASSYSRSCAICSTSSIPTSMAIIRPASTLTAACAFLFKTTAMKAFLNWSGGKDSALCLYESRRHGPAPEALVTTVSAASGRVSMHGVHGSLIAQQAASVQLPLHLLPLEGTGMQAYEEAIGQANRSFRARGF